MKIDATVFLYTLFVFVLLPIVSLYVAKLGTFGFYRGRFLFVTSISERFKKDGNEVKKGEA